MTSSWNVVTFDLLSTNVLWNKFVSINYTWKMEAGGLFETLLVVPV